MAWQFRQRFKVLPGIYLNFSNSGISSTIGIPGANVNIEKRGLYSNIGIPGTGLHRRDKINFDQPELEVPLVDNSLKDRIAFANYYVEQMKIHLNGLERMHANDLISNDEFNQKCESIMSDPKYLEIQAMLQSIETKDAIFEDEAIDVNESEAFPIWIKIVVTIGVMYIVVTAYLRLF